MESQIYDDNGSIDGNYSYLRHRSRVKEPTIDYFIKYKLNNKEDKYLLQKDYHGEYDRDFEKRQRKEKLDELRETTIIERDRFLEVLGDYFKAKAEKIKARALITKGI